MYCPYIEKEKTGKKKCKIIYIRLKNYDYWLLIMIIKDIWVFFRQMKLTSLLSSPVHWPEVNASKAVDGEDTRQKDPERTPLWKAACWVAALDSCVSKEKKILLFQDMNFKVYPNPLLLLSNDYKGYIVIKIIWWVQEQNIWKSLIYSNSYMYIHIYHTYIWI